MTLRRALFIGLAVLLLMPLLLAFWLLSTEPGARFAWRQAEAAAGGRLLAEQVSGSLFGGIEIAGLTFRDESLELDVAAIAFSIEIGLKPLALGVDGASMRSVRVLVKPATGDDGDIEPGDVIEQLDLPVVLTLSALVANDVTIEGLSPSPRIIDRLALSGSLHETLAATLEVDAPEGRASVSGTLGLEPPYSVNADMSLVLVGPQPLTAEASVDGTLDAIDIVAAGRAAFEGYAPVAVELEGRATQADLHVIRFKLESDDAELAASGDVEWSEGLSVAGNIELARAEVGRFVESWPEGYPVSGVFDIAYSPGTLEIDDADFAIAGRETRIRGDLAIDAETSSVDGSIAWQGLGWPLDDVETGIQSPAGDIRLEGNLDDWRASGELKLDMPGVEPESILVEVDGGRDAAEILVHEAGVLGGRLAGNAAVSWRGTRDWSASLELDGIRPDALMPALRGRLSGRVVASGSASPLAFDARLEDVNGQLAGRPLAANGRVRLDAGVVRARELFIRHGENEVTLNGSPQLPDGLLFSARVDELGDYLSAASGGVRATGSVGIQDDVPWLKLTAAAEQLRFGDVLIEGFRIDDLVHAEDTRSQLNISAAAVAVGDHRILEPSAELKVGAESQSIEVDVGYEGLKFAALVEGALDSWTEPHVWLGELKDLQFAFSGHPPVELANSADIGLSREHVFIERLCLREPGGASVCAALSWREGGRTDVSVVMTAMPLQMINALADTGFEFEQRLDGEFEWHRATGTRPSGRGLIQASAGSIDSLNHRDVSFATADSTISFDIVDGRLQNGSLELPMPGTGAISGSFDVLDLSNPLDSAVQGAVVVSLDDIGLLAALTPLVDEATGALGGRIDIGGSVSAPLLSGQATLSDGGLHYDAVGLKLSDISMTARLDGDRGIAIDGDFASGAGRGRVVSRGGGIDLSITGRNLTLIDVEEVSAVADLDMGLAYADGALTIDGRVGIPHALVSPTSLPASRATESDDAVVVNGELPDRDGNDVDAALRILGSLEVELGDDVHVDLGVADATVTGQTLFTWSGPPVPMANGRFDIGGQIQAFGQRLTVTEGRIRYADVSADNPTIRLRAEREIFGNSQVKTAGVLVAGPLERPTMEAYTVPRTTEERALTLLVTGSDFDLEQGVGAVDFGTYIAPRLYVSYGVGIFERDNVISARYDLDGGFGIRATSGQRESGVDVIYRLER